MGGPAPSPSTLIFLPTGHRSLRFVSRFFISPLTSVLACLILYLSRQYSKRRKGGVYPWTSSSATRAAARCTSRSQIKGAILRGEAKAGDPLPSIRSLAKALHISILTVQKAYDTLQEEGFIETTAGKGCYVAPQNQDFYLEEQQKKIEEKFAEAITIARASGISLEKLTDLLSLMYEEDE